MLLVILLLTNLMYSQMIVRPNPFNGDGELIVKVDGEEYIKKVDVRIYDMSGKLIFEKKLYNEKFFNSYFVCRMYLTLPNGVYILQVITDNKVYNKKVIVN
ncbi:MAG: T9SS type A sorting domain-containing protein [Leuconostoc falkenbergense]|uniref:T9SS type A sorting domain-containing protein n=1 Tax=Leuconostoc falkenbergense TaxID=2766470 RepID=UPI003BB61326